MSNTDRAHRNSEYVRRLLKKKWPEFAAVLERVVWELDVHHVQTSSVSPGPPPLKLSSRRISLATKADMAYGTTIPHLRGGRGQLADVVGGKVPGPFFTFAHGGVPASAQRIYFGMNGRVRRPNRRQIGLICTQPSGEITNGAAEQNGG